eukprot:COSAG01_NODE_46312_length_401_cov_0.807947_2_plen_47_part_00
MGVAWVWHKAEEHSVADPKEYVYYWNVTLQQMQVPMCTGRGMPSTR